MGRYSLKHNGFKVISHNKSIQGQWRPYLFEHKQEHRMLDFINLPAYDLSEKKLGELGIARRNRLQDPLNESTVFKYKRLKIERREEMI